MEENIIYDSDDYVWIAAITIIIIVSLLLLHLSPSIDTILRGCFFVTLCGFLETYLPKRR